MTEESMFYLIVRDDDSRYRKHYTKKGAIEEASRLADLDWAHTFYVLKAKYKVSRVIPLLPPPNINIEPLHRFTPQGEY